MLVHGVSNYMIVLVLGVIHLNLEHNSVIKYFSCGLWIFNKLSKNYQKLYFSQLNAYWLSPLLLDDKTKLNKTCFIYELRQLTKIRDKVSMWHIVAIIYSAFSEQFLLLINGSSHHQDNDPVSLLLCNSNRQKVLLL